MMTVIRNSKNEIKNRKFYTAPHTHTHVCFWAYMQRNEYSWKEVRRTKEKN